MIFSVPKLNHQSLKFIQNIRKIHDPKGHDFIDPHFTFSAKEVNFCNERFTQNLFNNLKSICKFNFSIRRAIPIPPSLEHQSWYAFLVPEYGYLKFCELYSYIICSIFSTKYNSLFYLPHITIGSFRKKSHCISLINEINRACINITGCIDEVLFAYISNNHLVVSDKIILRESSYAFFENTY